MTTLSKLNNTTFVIVLFTATDCFSKKYNLILYCIAIQIQPLANNIKKVNINVAVKKERLIFFKKAEITA